MAKDRIDQIVGYVTHLGYLKCSGCVGADDPPLCNGAPAPIYFNSDPHAFQVCDTCGVQLNTGLRWTRVTVRDDWPETWEAQRTDETWCTVELQSSGRYAIGRSHRRGDVDSIVRGITYRTLEAAQAACLD